MMPNQSKPVIVSALQAATLDRWAEWKLKGWLHG